MSASATQGGHKYCVESNHFAPTYVI